MDKATILQVLSQGQVTLLGQFTHSSNFTFLVACALDGVEVRAVYKPARGQVPLWDFESASLPRREAAAYLLSEQTGWDLVPPTVYRTRGLPASAGSLQLYIEHDPDAHYFNLGESERESLKPMVVFDLVVNNADRKGGHVLKDRKGRLWGIDHALCFHAENKLRTVIWDFAGQPIPEELLKALEKLSSGLEEPPLSQLLGKWLSREEIRATRERCLALLQSGCFPQPESDRWMIPWPPL
ncbi:MAG: SCO1664 family protein [Anaerolineaceae bacterium]